MISPLISIISYVVKNVKFGKAKEYLQNKKECEIKLSFKHIENKTKLVKKEIRTASFRLQDNIIIFNNEMVKM